MVYNVFGKDVKDKKYHLLFTVPSFAKAIKAEKELKGLCYSHILCVGVKS